LTLYSEDIIGYSSLCRRRFLESKPRMLEQHEERAH
jgi:hypothetical protein